MNDPVTPPGHTSPRTVTPHAAEAPTPGLRALQAVCLGTLAFGVMLWAAPPAARALFALLMYGDPAAMDAWPPEVRHYVTLQHAVLGALMTGWAVALLLVLRCPAVPARTVIGVSVAAWYVPDVLLSGLLGVWPNVALNTGFALLFALALWLGRRRPAA